MVCLRYLIQLDRVPSKSRSHGSDSGIRTLHIPSLTKLPTTSRLLSNPDEQTGPNATCTALPLRGHFAEYASMFLFSHLNQVNPADDEIFDILSHLLSSTSVLRWIEFVAELGDLHIIYQAGKIIELLVALRARHSPPLGLARRQKQSDMVDRWGSDLIHLVTKFSRKLKLFPKSIYRLIPPFCPADSAIRCQFGNPHRGLTIQGLSARGWDDCLTTITYDPSMKPNAIAAGPAYFCCGNDEPRR